MSQIIAHLLHPSCVLLNQTYNDSEELIHDIADELFKAGFVKDTFAQAAIDREKKLPTGLPLTGGLNAAIPHTDIEHVIKPALGLVTLNEQINFRNMISPQEEVPVKITFVLALEKPKAQVEMLQEIAALLQNHTLVKEISQAASFGDVIKALKQ